MPRLSMNEQTTYHWSFEEDLLRFRDAGYDGLGIWTRKLRDFGEERAVELVEESGLAVSNVSWAGGFTGADAASADENLSVALDLLPWCEALRAESLTIHGGDRNGHTHRHVDRLLRQALDVLVPQAEISGVALVLEPMHPACAAGWTHLTSLTETLDILRDYNSAALRMAFDTYHFPVGKGDWPFLRELAPYLAVVHLGDVVEPHGVDQARVPLGEGSAPLAGIVRTLTEGGFRGFFDVKLTGPAFDALDYDAVVSESRRAFDALADFALSDSPQADADACNATW